jgi:hypothetical protein
VNDKIQRAGTLYDQGLDTHFRLHAAKGLRAAIRVDNLAPHWRRFSPDFRQLDDPDGPREGLHEIVYESYVDVGFLIPAALVRNRAAQELEKMVARMREQLAAG